MLFLLALFAAAFSEGATKEANLIERAPSELVVPSKLLDVVESSEVPRVRRQWRRTWRVPRWMKLFGPWPFTGGRGRLPTSTMTGGKSVGGSNGNSIGGSVHGSINQGNNHGNVGGRHTYRRGGRGRLPTSTMIGGKSVGGSNSNSIGGSVRGSINQGNNHGNVGGRHIRRRWGRTTRALRGFRKWIRKTIKRLPWSFTIGRRTGSTGGSSSGASNRVNGNVKGSAVQGNNHGIVGGKHLHMRLGGVADGHVGGNINVFKKRVALMKKKMNKSMKKLGGR